VIEGRVGDVPISTERRGLIQKVSPATRKALEQAMADPVVRRAMEAANFTHLTLTDPRGEGKPDKWSAAKDAFGRLWIHPRTGDVIASSAVPERRAGGLGRVILHEAGHEHWDNAGPAKQKMFAAALAKSPELVDEIDRIVSLKTPKGAFDPDRDRTASEVHSELQAMRVYDPARYARLPAAIREAADAIYSG
jgi:hypothetical protein